LQLRSWFEITAYRPSSGITVHRLHRQSFVTTAHRLQRPPWWCATIVYPLSCVTIVHRLQHRQWSVTTARRP
jgi:hypothetical protein